MGRFCPDLKQLKMTDKVDLKEYCTLLFESVACKETYEMKAGISAVVDYLQIGKGQKLPIHGVTHRYFTLHEAKPENGKPCIVNNGADNYHIAFWDEKANGFVNQTGYLQKEFDKWLYLPINGG
jgi:hypothetical protein